MHSFTLFLRTETIFQTSMKTRAGHLVLLGIPIGVACYAVHLQFAQIVCTCCTHAVTNRDFSAIFQKGYSAIAILCHTTIDNIPYLWYNTPYNVFGIRRLASRFSQHHWPALCLWLDPVYTHESSISCAYCACAQPSSWAMNTYAVMLHTTAMLHAMFKRYCNRQ